MNPNLVIDLSYTDLQEISSRSKKYITCLQLVHRVLCREMNTDIPLPLFNQLGMVAGFVDQHLDELSIDEQRVFAQEYDRLFENIWSESHYLMFKLEICGFVKANGFHFSTDNFHIKDLFLFMKHCKKMGLKEDLKIFGNTIISCAIAKHSAETTSALKNELSREGQAVINLLRSLLKCNHKNNNKLEPTLLLLKELEHILNLADDTLDVGSDRRRGLLNSKLGRLHQPKLFLALAGQIMKTILKYPLKTGYYAPRLSWYYFKHTWH